LRVGATVSNVIVKAGHAAIDKALEFWSRVRHVTLMGFEGTLIVAPGAVEQDATALRQVPEPVGPVKDAVTVTRPAAASRMFPGQEAMVSVGFATGL
jgi:hypothetical protein